MLGVPHVTTSGRFAGGETGLYATQVRAPNVHNTPLGAQGHRTLDAAPRFPGPPLIPFHIAYR